MIERTPDKFTGNHYDLVIIGGGIYGACLSLEASRRGLSSILLERDDYGGATSWNSLRILHGGLRYLQTFDLPRFRESVTERHWFCKNFPDFVRPLPCLMPLYGRGLKRRATFGPALILNDFLSSHRNDGVVDQVKLPRGRLVEAEQTREKFPLVNRERLEGAGFWYDAMMVNSQRVLMETLHWSCSKGGRALNYVEARELLTESGQVVGVRGWDKLADREVEYRASIVINCAGPWSREVASRFDRDLPRLFHASLAFNVLVEREPLASTALAVQPPHAGAQVYFMHPVNGGILLGTIHAPWKGPVTTPVVEEPLLNHLIQEVNLAVPGFELKRGDICRVLSGLLPAATEGSDKISRRPAMHLHGNAGGPRGLLSLCGVKFTTARRVAEQALAAVKPAWRGLPRRPGTERPRRTVGLDLSEPETFLKVPDAIAAAEVARLIREESITCAADLILRRTNWGLNPKYWTALTRRISEMHPDVPVERQDLQSWISTQAAV